MKTYKDFYKRWIGGSDGASLYLLGRTESGTIEKKELCFGEDGDYKAYIVYGEDVEIGDHYKLVATFYRWFVICDDDGLSFQAKADEIRIYRAGEWSCIIQLIGFREEG